MGVASRLGQFLGRTPDPDDPLINRLADVPIPLPEVGPLAEGLELKEDQVGLQYARSRGDRELGAIAEYELRATPREETVLVALEASDGEPPPMMSWLGQSVVLLSDADAATRWFATKLQRFDGYEGRLVDGFFYRKVDVEALTGLGDEAAITVAYTYTGEDTLFVDTYIVARSGRLFGSVATSTFKELDVRAELMQLARSLLSRIEALA